MFVADSSRTVCIVTSQVSTEWEQDFERWNVDERIPALQRLPGYLAARRYLAVDGDPRHMIFL